MSFIFSHGSSSKQQGGSPAICFAGAAVAGAALAAGAMLLASRKRAGKKADEKNIYESNRSLSEYLLFHFGAAHELLTWQFGPQQSLSFPADLGTRGIEFCKSRGVPTTRALDIGCAVGRTSFELSKAFDAVIGIDYSHSFIGAAQQLAKGQRLSYQRFDEGDISTPLTCAAPAGARCETVAFEQGDACSLRADLGDFDLVVAANLVCRLPNARPFLARLAQLVRPGGVLFLTTPFTWMEQFTPKENWLGGYYDAAGCPVDSFATMSALLNEHFTLVAVDDMQFFIREHNRKNQWSVAKASFWIRK